MQVAQLNISPQDRPDSAALRGLLAEPPDLVLLFGDAALLHDAAWLSALRDAWPTASLAGCSTAGQIQGETVHSHGGVLTAVRFEHAHCKVLRVPLNGLEGSREAGKALARALTAQTDTPPRGVIVLAQGVNINGSCLIEGLQSGLPPQVVVAGGLAGDDGAFARTWVLSDDGPSAEHVVGIGLYGEALCFGQAAYGGWKPFGMVRRATRVEGSRLYELDGEPALELYRRYLGDHAQDLPASGLLFPFEVLDEQLQPTGLVRTILGIDADSGSLTLAGDLPHHSMLRLMYASTDALVDGAQTAAEHVHHGLPAPAELALLVSCVGRKLVMGERVEEELEAVQGSLGPHEALAGFYSYGEIAPLGHDPSSICSLNNQTMTILGLCERPAA